MITPGAANYEQSLADRNPADPANETILSGDIGVAGDPSDNSHHVILAANLTGASRLDGLTIADGTADELTFEFGGGVLVDNADLTIAACIFRGHSANAGGGVYVSDGSTVAVGMPAAASAAAGDGVATIFQDNTAFAGGGLYVAPGGTATIGLVPGVAGGTPRTRFENNLASAGGAIYLAGNPVTATGVDFIGNTARFGGGAYIMESNLDLSISTFDGNMGVIDPLDTGIRGDSTWGGAIYAEMSSVSLASTNLKSNVVSADFTSGGASVFGGAIYATLSNIDLSVVNFEDNAASAASAAVEGTDVGGGAITLQLGSLTADGNTSFVGNRVSAGDGIDGDALGGAVAASTAMVVLDGTRFQNNAITTEEAAARATGGALYFQDDIAGSSVTGCDFVGNTCPGNGGAIALFDTSGDLPISGGLFDGNTAGGFGGAIVRDGSQSDIIGATFNANSAFRGGAISSINGATGSIDESAFTANTATDDGGAIDIRKGSTVTVRYGSFLGNTADADGGAVRVAGATTAVTMVNSIFSGNTAPNGRGGALYNAAGTSTVLNCTFSRNCSEVGGGGGVRGAERWPGDRVQLHPLGQQQRQPVRHPEQPG